MGRIVAKRMKPTNVASEPSSRSIDTRANLFLLQSRYWRNKKIGLREVKKLFSLMHEKQASGVFLLTTGIFTNEARHYAAGRPITLVDGIELVELLGKVKSMTATESGN